MDVSRKINPRTFSTASLVLALLFIFSSCNACQPAEEEITESKYYRSQIAIQATISTQGDDVVARVARTLKGVLPVDSQITLTGFGTEDPCFLDSTDLSESIEYILFLGELRHDGYYPIVANPIESTNEERKTIRKFARDGAAPTFAKELKDKMYAPGSRTTLSCIASGFPSPSLTMTKDGVILSKGAVQGISYKSGKGGIRLKLKNMQQSLHEGVYACIADNGVHPQIMMSATIGICTLSCENGELNLKKCECQCEKGWNGLTCNIQLDPVSPSMEPCRLDCGKNGRIDSEQCRCQCDANYIGDTCDALCDRACDTHGTLDPFTCSCHCDNGYYGDTCSNTADQLCNEGSYCHNGGTCYQADDAKTRQLVFLCRCPPSFVGNLCEIPTCNIDCGPHGAIDDMECRCVCDDEYRGTYCEALVDDHTEPCGPQYEHYCMNGGECVQLVGISKASCRCPLLYYGNRCDRLAPDLDCGCMNGGVCQYNETKKEYECICPTNFGGTRCQYVKPGYSESSSLHHRAHRVKRYKFDTQEISRKMVITMCVIFIAMLIVIGLVVIVYIKNRNAREKERREKLEQMIIDQRNGMRLRSSLQSTGGMQATGAGGSYPADDIEMTSFRHSSNQQPEVNTENEHQLGTRKSSNHSQGRGSLPRSRNGSMNGMPIRSSQTSLHSNRSQGEGRAGPQTRGGKEGYKAVPTQEQPGDQEVQPQNNSDTSLEGPGDPDTLPLKHPRASSDLGSDSEESEGEGDIIDVPNPQIQAIQNHLGGSDHDSGDYTWDEHSSPGLRITSPYPHDTSPLHQPRGRGRLNGTGSGRSPDRVNIHENPLEDPGSKTDAMNNVMSSDTDAYYADRLKDVVEDSTPSAV